MYNDGSGIAVIRSYRMDITRRWQRLRMLEFMNILYLFAERLRMSVSGGGGIGYFYCNI